MPPTAILMRVFAFFILIAGAIAFLYYLIFYIFYPRAGVVAAKVDATHKVDEVKSEVKQQEIYDDAIEKIKDIRKRSKVKNR
jgi:hypothetical protein